MQINNFIEFKKERDLGAIITDTFAFIRENWKPYFGAILKIAGPFILAGSILIVLFFGYYLNVLGNFQTMGTDGGPEEAISLLLPLYGWMSLFSIVFLLVYIVVSLTSLFYIKSYIANDGVVNIAEVRTNTFKNIFKFLGLGILIGIIAFVGFVLCILPGIYLGITLTLATSIMVFEGRSIGDSISHCFTLIKEQWWSTFGVIIVVGILVNILSYAFSVPGLIYELIKGGTMLGSDDPTQIFNIMNDPVSFALNVLSYIGQFVLSSISLIASVFIYFDLNEQKNLTGTIEKIDSLGGPIQRNE